MLLEFEDFEVDTDQLELRRSGVAVRVEPQVFSLLEVLVANAHRVVSKEEINETVWGGRIVSDAALSSRVRSLRQAIGDDGKRQRLVKTIRDRGFRFVGDVTATGTAPRAIVDESELAAAVGSQHETERKESAEATIAVLPLHPLVDDPLRAPLADAVSHEIITELSRLRWLRVTARGSSFRFRGNDLDLREVGRILGVRYIVCGSYSVFGQSCLVTVELARPADGVVVWADRIETTLDEIMSLRMTLSSKIAAQIEGRIQGEEARLAAATETHDLDSWSAYFRGLWHANRFNAHDNETATHLFQRAVELDPGFARAHAGLSFAAFQNAFVGFKGDRREQARLARSHAERALELDPTDPFVNLTMGRADLLSGEWDHAGVWFDRATELNSNNALAFYHRALSDAVLSNGEKGPEFSMRAVSLSPVDPMRYAMLASRGLCHLNRGDYEAACTWSERGAKEPNAHVLISMIAALANQLAGQAAEASDWADRAREQAPRITQEHFFRSFPFARAELRQTVARALTQLGI